MQVKKNVTITAKNTQVEFLTSKPEVGQKGKEKGKEDDL